MPNNIILFMSDQLRRQVLGHASPYSAATPHMDALAATGVQFENACSVYPICVPARFALMTGAYPHTRFVPGIEWRMSPAEYCLGHEMAGAGYQPAYVGKWHLYGGHGVLPGHSAKKADKTRIPPAFRGGFERWRGFDVANDPFDTWYFEQDEREPRRLEGYQTDALVTLATDTIAELASSTRPFFLVVSVEPPHFPLEAPDAYLRRVREREHELPPNFLAGADEAMPGHRRGEEDREALIAYLMRYKAMVENLDDNIGRLVGHLEERGLRDTTDLVVTSDHGQMDGAHGLRSIVKGYPFDESVGVPLIFNGPSVPAAQRGSCVSTPVSLIDLPVTFAAMASGAGDSGSAAGPHATAGLHATTGPQRLVAGRDLSPLIRGEATGMDREAVYLEFVHDLRPGHVFHARYWRAVRSERYLYAVLGGAEGSRPWMLFDRREDPFEMDNLLAEPDARQGTDVREIAAHHHTLLRRELIASEDHFVLSPAYGMEGVNEWKRGAE